MAAAVLNHIYSGRKIEPDLGHSGGVTGDKCARCIIHHYSGRAFHGSKRLAVPRKSSGCTVGFDIFDTIGVAVREGYHIGPCRVLVAVGGGISRTRSYIIFCPVNQVLGAGLDVARLFGIGEGRGLYGRANV